MKKIFFIAIVLWYACGVCAEVIRFKNGKIIEGDVTERDATSIKVDTSGIAITYYLDEIESIDGKPSAVPAQRGDEVQELSALGKKIFKDPAWGYSLTYPAGWEVIPESERKNQFAVGFRPLGAQQKYATLIMHHRYLRPDELDKVKDIKALAKLFPPPSELRLAKEETITINNEPAYHAHYTDTASYTKAKVEGREINLSGETVAHYDYYYYSPAFSSGNKDKRLFVFFSQYIQYADLLEKNNATVNPQVLETYKRSNEELNRTINSLAQQLTQIAHSLNYSLAPIVSVPSDAAVPVPVTPLSLGKMKETQGFLQQARYFLKEKKFEDTLTQLQKAVEIDPQLTEAYLIFGETYMMLGKYDESAAAFKKCLSIMPNYPNAYLGLAYLYVAQGQYQEALTHLQKALQLAPEYLEAQFLLGSLYSQLGRYPEAIELLEKVAPKMPVDAEVHAILGYAYFYDARFEKAVDTFKAVIAKNATRATAYHGLGLTYAALNRFSESKVSLQQARMILKGKGNSKETQQTIQDIDDFLKKLP